MPANDKPTIDGCDLSRFMEGFNQMPGKTPFWTVNIGGAILEYSTVLHSHWRFAFSDDMGEDAARALIQELVLKPIVRAVHPDAQCVTAYTITAERDGWLVVHGADPRERFGDAGNGGPTEFAAWYFAAQGYDTCLDCGKTSITYDCLCPACSAKEATNTD